MLEPTTEFFAESFEALNLFLADHMGFIAGAISASALVIASRDIDRIFREQVKRKHFLWRTLLFILVCGVGYEIATALLTEFLLFLVRQKIGLIYLAPLLVLLFVLIGIGAQRKKYI